MSDLRQIRDANEWSLASDGLQWILQHRRQKNGRTSWRPVSFVRSTRAILARCMREKGVPTADAEQLLAGLPPTFDEWLQGYRSWSETFNAPPLAPTTDLLDRAETRYFRTREAKEFAAGLKAKRFGDSKPKKVPDTDARGVP